MSIHNLLPILLIATVSMAFVIPADPSIFTTAAPNETAALHGTEIVPYNASSDELAFNISALTANCPENEFIPPDCNPIEQTCDAPFPAPLKGCPKTGACQCLPNFYRHNGTCVPARECPQGSNALLESRQLPTLDSCKANEQWYGCGRSETTCTPNPFGSLFINMWCQQPGCYCAPGFVRDLDLGCIRSADCPKKAETTTASS
uniref:TIL domain-containing protein n=1 Tax=Panagrellus redivivus TaxID=6233 RepID=A0A7E4UV62_PANRE